MDAYPFNLILAVATASASIFLGFLPTKSISSSFFTRESSKFILAWVLVALTSPTKIAHYPLFYAFLSFAAWWNFRKDNAFSGKMWLSVASGLGISTGIMFILAVTPRAYPPGLTPLSEGLLLTSIYLGSGIIGLAYVCFTFIQSTKINSGVTQNVIQRYVGLLPYLTLVRAAVIVATFFLLPGHFENKTTWYNANTPPVSEAHHGSATTYFFKASDSDTSISLTVLAPMALAVLVLPLLAFLAQKQTHLSSRVQPTRTLIAIILIGFLTEILARLLIL